MGIARSTYYDCPEKRADDTAIVEAMFAICDEFEFYGYRRVGAALRQQGIVVNHKKIRRLMREHGAAAEDPKALRRHHRQRPRGPDLPEPGEGSRSERSQPALGLRHHLCRCIGSLHLCRHHPGRLVAPDRRLRHRPLDRCAPDGRGAENCHRPQKAAARLHPSFRSRLAICRRDLPAAPCRPWPDRLDGPQRQPV